MKRRTRSWASFDRRRDHKPLAVIELKGPKVHLDRHRSNGRTAVAQCWDYLVNTPPECRWGIVSNIVSFRLYERASTKRAYEHFTLQSLRDFDVFKQFYVLFHRQGLIDESLLGPPRAVALLKKSAERQREVSDQLYDAYSRNRTELIAELHFKQNRPLDEAIEMAQRLFDRIMFIAFCEDRQLLAREDDPQGLHAWPAFTPSPIPAGRISRTSFASSTPATTPTAFPSTTAGCSRRTRSMNSNCPTRPGRPSSIRSAPTTSPTR